MSPAAGRVTRTLAVVVVGLVAANLLVAGAGLTAADQGPPSSSYTTGPAGVAAYAELLAHEGHPVERARVPLERPRLDPRAVLVLLDPPTLSARAAARLRRFVGAGGLLIAGGFRPQPWLGRLLDHSPTWAPLDVETALPEAPVRAVAGLTSVVADGVGAWISPGEALRVLGAGDRDLVLWASQGAGDIALLADTSVLHNRNLGEADNAVLGASLAGGGARPVLFVESIHGYRQASGLAALPTRWRWVLGGLALAALTWLAAHARRLGPPDPAGEVAPPRRRAHVDALAGILMRTGQPDAALAPLQRALRAEIGSRSGLSPETDPGALAQAGVRLGLSPEEARAAVGNVRDADDVMTVGRALARLRTGGARKGGA